MTEGATKRTRKAAIALSTQLHTGIDYLSGLPLDRLNDLCEDLIELRKEQREQLRRRN